MTSANERDAGPRVVVLLPAYNEEATLGAVLERLETHCPGFDIAVIDDGSRDETARVALRYARVTLLQLPYNVGIGGAMQTGYRFALRNGYDIAVQCDSDGQHPVEELPRLVEKLCEGALDLAIGSRYVRHTGYRPTFARRVGKSLLSRIIHRVTGWGITDTTSGFRAANRRVIALFAAHYPEDYPEPESLVLLHLHGLRAGELPVTMSPRQGGVTSISPSRAFYYIVKVLLAIFVDMFRRYERPEPEAAAYAAQPAPAEEAAPDEPR